MIWSFFSSEQSIADQEQSQSDNILLRFFAQQAALFQHF
jgi:hypothetical protein